MKNGLDRNFFISFVILIFRLFIIAFIVTFVVSLPLLSLDIISNFWEFHFCYSSFTFIYFGYVLANKDEGIMFDFLLTKDFKDDTDLNTYSKKDLGTLPEIDDTDLNAYSKKDLCWSIDSIKHKKEIKQFCYDSSNPCHYCDTKFEHTGLHCAIYFSDIERLQEVIEFIKKVDGVDSYEASDFYYSMCGKIFNSKDLTSQGLIPLALSIGNIKIIKFLLQIVTTKGSEKLKIYVGNNQSIDINPHDEESINGAIDYFKYKKKTKTGKDILDKHQE